MKVDDKKLDFIRKVFYSCKTYDQALTALQWSRSMCSKLTKTHEDAREYYRYTDSLYRNHSHYLRIKSEIN